MFHGNLFKIFSFNLLTMLPSNLNFPIASSSDVINLLQQRSFSSFQISSLHISAAQLLNNCNVINKIDFLPTKQKYKIKFCSSQKMWNGNGITRYLPFNTILLSSMYNERGEVEWQYIVLFFEYFQLKNITLNLNSFLW